MLLDGQLEGAEILPKLECRLDCRVYEKWLSSTWKFIALYTSYAAVQFVALVITVMVSFFLIRHPHETPQN
jgi:hypothetical protein